jgi:hypothetical protein
MNTITLTNTNIFVTKRDLIMKLFNCEEISKSATTQLEKKHLSRLINFYKFSIEDFDNHDRKLS